MMIYYYLCVFVFLIGLLGPFIKKDLFSTILCIQVLFSSIQLLFVLLSKSLGNIDGQIFAFFSMLMSGFYSVFGMILITYIYKRKNITLNEELSLNSD